jgi:hypothetical protein
MTLEPGTTAATWGAGFATRLTQANKREVKGSDVPAVALPKVEHHCRNCGAKVPSDKERCLLCWKRVTRVNFRAGRKAAQRPEFLAKRAATMHTHRQEISNWKPSDLPAWLTREVYVERVQPALARVAKSRIRSALGVSEPYSSDIQAGKRVPHPRHWLALARLVDVFPVLGALPSPRPASTPLSAAAASSRGPARSQVRTSHGSGGFHVARIREDGQGLQIEQEDRDVRGSCIFDATRQQNMPYKDPVRKRQ